MPSKEEVVEWSEVYRVAWEERDSEAASSLFTDDASYRSNIYEEPNQGRVGVAQYWAGVTSVQSDIRVRMGTPFVDGERAVVEFWTKMRVEDNPVTLAGCLLLRFSDDGLCSDLREYWNFIDGTHQPPDGWGD